MQHYGDITKLNGAELPIVDIITGGSPCQDLSVAGKRAGLAGERSGLFMEQIRIIKEMREHDKASGRTNEYIRPRYMVWENVPGAFSSNKGEDFRAVLEETAKIVDENAAIPRPEGGRWTNAGCIMADGWSIAWRVHDAQFWGVPQRRRRIALVADFGGQTAPEILFERESVSGDIKESREKGKESAGTIEDSTGKTVFGICAYDSNSMKSSNPESGIYKAETSRTLDNGGGNPACNQGGMVVLEGNGTRESHKGDGYKESDVSYTLNSTEQHGVLAIDRAAMNQGQNASYDFSIEENLAQPLMAQGPGGANDTVGALCARDFKGVGSQYVDEGKCVICDS